MAFNSLHFALFFLIIYVLYRLLPHTGQNRLLLVASYVFYAFWDWRFLSLIILSTIVNFYSGSLIEKTEDEKKRKAILIANICYNLGVLGFFKYFGFFAESLRIFLASFGVHLGYTTFNIILPLGISFYTFQVMSYTIDIYWRRLKPTTNIFDFALFVSFFPQIVSGPIERARNMLPQIANERKITLEQFYGGCWLIFWGLYKKIVIADNLAIILQGAFDIPQAFSGGIMALATIGFAFQLYADFSGYSDMARGLARIMGFDIMANFRAPFFAINPSDLWQRWHISLTTWIKEYLFYPLALAKFFGRQLAATLVIILTWAIMGFWHGPNMKFIVWGIYHGILIIVYSKLRPYITMIKPHNRILSVIWVFAQTFALFILFCIGILCFAAPSLAEVSATLMSIIFNFTASFQFDGALAVWIFILFVPLFIVEYFQHRSDDEFVTFTWPAVTRAGLYYVVAYLIIFFGDFGAQKYYYFQF